MQEVTLHDKTFDKYISEEQISQAIKALAKQLKRDFSDKNPLFLAVLNGSFMFASDLMKHIDFLCEIQFVKVQSYDGTSSTEDVKDVFGITPEMVRNKTIILLEDIVDTGYTIAHLYVHLSQQNAKDIHVATMLFKPEAYKKDIPVNYKALEIPNDFVVGYGLDYKQLGRNLTDIYKLKDTTC